MKALTVSSEGRLGVAAVLGAVVAADVALGDDAGFSCALPSPASRRITNQQVRCMCPFPVAEDLQFFARGRHRPPRPQPTSLPKQPKGSVLQNQPIHSVWRRSGNGGRNRRLSLKFLAPGP